MRWGRDNTILDNYGVEVYQMAAEIAQGEQQAHGPRVYEWPKFSPARWPGDAEAEVPRWPFGVQFSKSKQRWRVRAVAGEKWFDNYAEALAFRNPDYPPEEQVSIDNVDVSRLPRVEPFKFRPQHRTPEEAAQRKKDSHHIYQTARVTCACGQQLARASMDQHLKSAKHIAAMTRGTQAIED